MNSLPLLSEADHSRLHALVEKQSVPCLEAEHQNALRAWLTSTDATARHAVLADRVALEDQVTLVSPLDSRDWFQLAVVLPEQVDLDADRVPVFTPVSLAVLGRRSGEQVTWQTPRGARTMTIVSIRKRER